MRPKSEKNKKRDLCRNRQFKVLNELYGGWEGWDFYHRTRWYPKKEARISGNRAVRRYDDTIPNGCTYRKIYDVQWEVL